MSLYFAANATWLVAEDSTKSQVMSSRSTSKIEPADITEHYGANVSIPDGTTDQAIGFTGADKLSSAKALLIVTDQPISVKINGGDTGIPIGHTADETASLQLDATNITSLSVTNASGKTANIYISLPGA